MHAISFLLKRGHLTTTGASQRILYDVPGMTPARFDILCFARQNGIRLKVKTLALTSQRRIIEALGLHPSTVSKMLKRLEQKGWIERERDFDDRRRKIVELTKLGRRKIWEAMRINFRGRTLAEHFEWIARQLRPLDHPLKALDHTFETLDFVACAFGNTSSFHYDFGSPRHPPYCLSPAQPREPRYVTPRGYDLGPEILDGARDPNEPKPLTAYQKWLAPLLRAPAAAAKAAAEPDAPRGRWGTKTRENPRLPDSDATGYDDDCVF